MDDATLAEAVERPRVVVFFATPRSRLARALDDLAQDSSVPVLRVPKGRAPARLAYYEHGERLEDEIIRSAAEAEAFLERVESLQEQWRVVRGRLRVDQFG